MYDKIIILGVIISIVYYEYTGFSPAGLIVSGYLALCLQTPERILYTLFVVFLTWGAARILSRWFILYGRRRFSVMILLSYFIHSLIVSSGLMGNTPGLIGCLVPGIIAQEFERQGVVISLVSLGIVTGILSLILLYCGFPVLSGFLI